MYTIMLKYFKIFSLKGVLIDATVNTRGQIYG